MRSFRLAVIPILALIGLVILFGCGGGGGSTGGGGGGNGTTIRVEAQNTFGTQVDPTNILPGDTIKFIVATYDQFGARTVNTPSGWTTDDTTNVAGTLSSDGTYAATASNDQEFHATVTFNGANRSSAYHVRRTGTAIVTGRIRNSSSNGGVGAVRVLFVDGNGNHIGSALSLNDGTIKAFVLVTAAGFTVDSIDTTIYNNEFVYNNFSYSGTIPGCYATLPPVSAGNVTDLVTSISLNPITGGPPGPPTGCGP